MSISGTGVSAKIAKSYAAATNRTRLVKALQGLLLARDNQSFAELEAALLTKHGQAWPVFAAPETDSMREFVQRQCEGLFVLHEGAEGQDMRVSCASASSTPAVAASSSSSPAATASSSARPSAGTFDENAVMAFLSEVDQARLINALRAVFRAHDNNVYMRQLDAFFETHHGQNWEQFAGEQMRGVSLKTFVYRHMPDFFHLIEGSGVACTLNADGSMPKPRVLSMSEGRPQKDNKPYRVMPCIFFAEGRCPRGESCSYKHDPNNLADLSAAAPPPIPAATLVSSSAEMVAEQELLGMLRAHAAPEGLPALELGYRFKTAHASDLNKLLGCGFTNFLSKRKHLFVLYQDEEKVTWVSARGSHGGKGAAAAPAVAITPTGSAAASSSSASAVPSSVTASPLLLFKDGKPWKREPCIYWPLGQCYQGSECGYIHDPSLTPAKQPKPVKPAAPVVSTISLAEYSTGRKPTVATVPAQAVTATPAATPIKSAAPAPAVPSSSASAASASSSSAAPPPSKSDAYALCRLRATLRAIGSRTSLSNLGGVLTASYGRLFIAPKRESLGASEFGALKPFLDKYAQYFIRENQLDKPKEPPLIGWNEHGPPLEEQAAVVARAEKAKEVAATAPSPSFPAAPVSDADILEFARHALLRGSAPMLLYSLGGLVGGRFGPLFPRPSASSFTAFIEAYPQCFKRHESSQSNAGAVSWIGSNSSGAGPASFTRAASAATPTVARSTASAPVTPAAVRLSDAALLEQSRLALQGFGAPVVLGRLGQALTDRHALVGRGSLKAFVEAYPEHFQRHENEKSPNFPFFSWKGPNSKIGTPAAASAPTTAAVAASAAVATSADAAAAVAVPSLFAAIMEEASVAFDSPSAKHAAGVVPLEDSFAGMSFSPPNDASSSSAVQGPADASSSSSASAAPTFEAQPPEEVGMDNTTQAYSDWYYTRGPGSVSAPSHVMAPGLGDSSWSEFGEEHQATSSSEEAKKEQTVAPAHATTTAETASAEPAASPTLASSPVVLSPGAVAVTTAASSPSFASAASATAPSTPSAPPNLGSSQPKLVRVLVHVPGMTKPVRCAAESIDELRREVSLTIDDAELLSEEVLTTAIFSVLQPTAAAPSPPALTDDALWALDKNTPLFLSWPWCAVPFSIQRLINPSATRQSVCGLCNCKLSHPKHDKPE